MISVVKKNRYAVNVLFWTSGKTQEEGLRRVEELKAELTSLKEANKEEKKSQIQLTQQVSDLTEELTKEKVRIFSFFDAVEVVHYKLKFYQFHVIHVSFQKYGRPVYMLLECGS